MRDSKRLKPMRTRFWLMPLAAMLLILQGCASNATTPVAVSCPILPPIPNALTSTVQTDPSLSKEWETLYASFEKAVADLLIKAQRTP